MQYQAYSKDPASIKRTGRMRGVWSLNPGGTSRHSLSGRRAILLAANGPLSYSVKVSYVFTILPVNKNFLATDDIDTLFCRIVVKYLCSFNYAMEIPSATSLLHSLGKWACGTHRGL